MPLPRAAAVARRSLAVGAAAGLAALGAATFAAVTSPLVDEKVRTVDPELLPDSLQGGEPAGAPGGSGEAYVPFALSADVEVLLPCPVDTAASDPPPRQVADAIVALATADERSSGCLGGASRNAVPPDLEVRSTAWNRGRPGVVEVDLGRDSLGGISATLQAMLFTQLVFTATAVDGVAGVIFLVDGDEVSVPRETRAAAPGSVLRRSDYPKTKAESERIAAFLDAVSR